MTQEQKIVADAKMLNEMDVIIRGGMDWLERAGQQRMKRSIDEIEHRRSRLATQRRIRDFLAQSIVNARGEVLP